MFIDVLYHFTLFLFLLAVVDELQVTITSNPDFGSFLAGSSVTLTCNVNGGHLPLMYEWSSTCDRDCFIDSQTTVFVVQNILHSVDTGNHTCLVTDYVGHTGSASIEMVITGMHCTAVMLIRL